LQGSSAWTQFTATALTDIHLRSNRENEMRVPGSITSVYTFSVIAVFILLIACINFMNLATARSAQRAKEIGVRKVAGAGRNQVISQFLAESVLLAAIALVLALTLVELALPAFNAFLEIEAAFDYVDNPRVALAIVLLPLATGLAAGSYPAFYLSAFEPAHVLKGDMTRGGGAAVFRKILVVLQFSISIALLIATAVVYQQMQFARNVELGYDKDRIVVVNGSSRSGLGEQWETLKREWLAHPDITHVTASMLTPSMQNTLSIGIAAEGRDPKGGGIPFLWIDYDFFETYGIELVAGRTFSEEFGSDRMTAPQGQNGRSGGAYVISELAARRFGWTQEEAVGKSLELTPRAWTRGPIVGVVKDIYFESVRSRIEPIVYMIPPDAADLGYTPLLRASLRVRGRDLANTLAHIDTKWAELVPDQPISRHFLDQDFEALYRSEQRQAQMFTFFSALAIFVACLGLFGLAAFTT
jgi:putative ABC transport system permease protein